MNNSIIQIDGKFYKKCKIVLLPTEKAKLHFFTLSDKEIKEGDWVFDTIINSFFPCSTIKQNFDNCKKIIATTDPELKLPRISNDFLKAYCEKGGIDEVLVEYEKYGINQNVDYNVFGYKLKVAPDNTITIKSVKSVKNSWNREEVKEIAKRYAYFVGTQLDPGIHIDKWIEENL